MADFGADPPPAASGGGGGDASGGGGGGGGFGITGALVVVLSGLAFVVHWMGLWGLSKHCEEYVPIAA